MTDPGRDIVIILLTAIMIIAAAHVLYRLWSQR